MSLTPELRKRLGSKRGTNKAFIYYELGLRNMNATKLAKELGCSTNNVSETICGNSHSEMVLTGLRDAGVPEKYLFDPRTTNNH